MATQVLVGKNATVYVWTPGTVDANRTFVAGSASNYLGIWESIEVEVMQEWIETTASAATMKEKTQTVDDWRATLTQQVRSGIGAVGLSLIMNYDYLYITFQDEANGKTVQLWGGIFRDRYKRDAGAGEDTLEIENVGLIGPGGVSILYA